MPLELKPCCQVSERALTVFKNVSAAEDRNTTGKRTENTVDQKNNTTEIYTYHPMQSSTLRAVSALFQMYCGPTNRTSPTDHFCRGALTEMSSVSLTASAVNTHTNTHSVLHAVSGAGLRAKSIPGCHDTPVISHTSVRMKTHKWSAKLHLPAQSQPCSLWADRQDCLMCPALGLNQSGSY